LGTATFDFSGKSVLVTGGARGIGLAVGEAFVRSGARVTLLDRDADQLTEAAASIGADSFTADVGQTEQVAAAVQDVVERTGSIDVLINNAGLLRDNVVWKIDDEAWADVMRTHAGGTFRFTRAVVPHMRKCRGGRIINVTSYTGLRGNTGQSNYSMAKAGIIGFTKSTAKELARFGITVNAISPNAETRMVESIPGGKRQELTAAIPMGRFGAPEEMAPAVLFLASEQASYITEVVLPIDGGISI
jgi:3-oxoacyl-[acyl-carrier protein] reductase